MGGTRAGMTMSDICSLLSFVGRSHLRRLSTTLCLVPTLPAAVWGAVAVTIAVIVGAASGAAKAEIATEPYIRSGLWDGGAYMDDDGQFSHCFFGGRYGNGVVLVVMLLDDGSWTLNLWNDAWRLDRGETYQVTVRIASPSDRTLAERRMEAHGDGKVLGIEIEPDDRLYDDLGQGRSLTVSTARETLHLGLKDMAGALQQLRDCVGRHG